MFQHAMGYALFAGAAPKGAWKAIWGSFCSSLQGEGRTAAAAADADGAAAAAAAAAGGGGGAAEQQQQQQQQQQELLWEEVVAWHSEVRKLDRVRLAERYAQNLAAGSLPPLRTVEPVEMMTIAAALEQP
jgi:hypothetical protein